MEANTLRHLISIALLALPLPALAGFFDGPELQTLADFKEGKFQFQSLKNIWWPQVVREGRQGAERAEKIWVPAVLFMPDNVTDKVPAMVIVHGIGGLYMRNGQKRAYWDYAELLATNGIAAVVVGTHGARGFGVLTQPSQTAVSVYTFVADAHAAADMLRTHPRIDGSRIGLMGFSKGGATTLLATDHQFSTVLSKTQADFALHIPIYPGCQVFPESPRLTGAPVHMLLGELDNFTGISGCFEIEAKLKASSAPVTVTVHAGAYHSWDENVAVHRSEDVSSADCRWTLKDGGEVLGGGVLLTSQPQIEQYIRSCMKTAEVYAGRNEAIADKSRKAVVNIARNELFSPRPPVKTAPNETLEEQLDRIEKELNAQPQ